jgi:hypothetical protein
MQPYLTRSRADFLYNPGKEIRREEAVEVLKGFIVKHLDKILMAIILSAAIAGTYYLEDRKIVLYFYYLPVLFSGYFFGRRLGVLTAVTSILVVLLGVWGVPGNSMITGIPRSRCNLARSFYLGEDFLFLWQLQWGPSMREANKGSRI